MNDNKFTILCDCDPAELTNLAQGMSDAYGRQPEFGVDICNQGHGSVLKVLWRYWVYFRFAWRVFLKRKQYPYIISWQQFFATNYALYCRIFRTKKVSTIMSCNFTYKKKRNPLIQAIYGRYMKFALKGDYVDYFHVLGYSYAERLSRELEIPIEKFVVTEFGVDDQYEEWSKLPSPVDYPYALAIGRSNRDFDHVVEVYKKASLKDRKLIIISDTWAPKADLPANITHLDSVTMERSYPYIANCELLLLPIDDSNICSGDTVLINGMMVKRPIVVTAPSTLSEMYVTDGVDGVYMSKNADETALKIASLDKEQLRTLGENARETYLERFSRQRMGYQMISKMLEKEKAKNKKV